MTPRSQFNEVGLRPLVGKVGEALFDLVQSSKNIGVGDCYNNNYSAPSPNIIVEIPVSKFDDTLRGDIVLFIWDHGVESAILADHLDEKLRSERRRISTIASMHPKYKPGSHFCFPSFQGFYGDISARLGFTDSARYHVGFRRTAQSNPPLDYGGEQSEYTGNSDPKTPLCPNCAFFPGLSCAPLSAKIAFVAPFWLFAWLAIFEGFGVGWSWQRRINLLWLVSGIAVGLIPLFVGIV